MRKSILPFFIFFIISYSAQNKKTLADYEVIAKISNNPIYMKATLLIENNSSLYVVNPKDVRYKKSDSITFSKEKNTYTKYSYSTNKNNFYLLKNSKNQSIQHTSGNNTKFLIEEKIYPFNWQITEESKKIGNFLCRKATTYFRGRNYIAWYSVKLPINAGPWKFSGLPGLIIEIYDDKKTFYWGLKKIKYPYSGNFEIKIPNKNTYSQIDLKKYVSIKEKNSFDFSKRLNSKLSKGSKIQDMKIKRNGIELVYEWE